MITIINYDAGNLRNVEKVFELYGEGTNISSSVDEIYNSKALVLPGVGHFNDGMKNLENLGLISCIQEVVLKKKTPILGICLGMQLMANVGSEGKKRAGLCLLPMNCKHLKITDNSLRIPHIGWNSIKINSTSILLRGIPDNSDFYFVHSYAVQTKEKLLISSTSTYGNPFISSVEYENIFATQFHPEKSQKYGQFIIKNFIDIVHNFRSK